MVYSFTCYGHENITAKHKTTLEFTKDKDLSLKADCIVGVRADFNPSILKRFIKNKINKEIKIIIQTISKNKNIQENIIAEFNSGFNDSREIVIRKTDFVSERTFATKANKAAFGLSRNLVGFLKDKKSEVRVIIDAKGQDV